MSGFPQPAQEIGPGATIDGGQVATGTVAGARQGLSSGSSQGAITAAQFLKLTAMSTPTSYTFAPSNASITDAQQADGLLTGTNDQAPINAVIKALGAAGGGRVHIAAGAVGKSGWIVCNYDNVTITGVYQGTFIQEAAGTATGGLLVGYEPVTVGSTISTVAGTINIGDTSKLAASGTVPIYAVPGNAPTVATYTGKTASTLTGVTIVTGSVVLTTASLVGIRNVTGLKIADLRFDGNYSNASGTTAVGALISAQLFKAWSCEFRSYVGDGWYLQPFDGTSTLFEAFLFDCYGRANGGHQIHIGTGVNNSEFIRCLPIGANTSSATTPNRGLSGFFIEGGGCKIIACHAYYNVQDGIQTRSTSSAITVVDGEYETNTRFGANVVGSTRVSFIGSRFYQNAGGEQIVAQTSPNLVNLMGCQVYLILASTTKAILFSGVTGGAIVNTLINGTGGSGLVRAISVEASSSKIEVAGNIMQALVSGNDVGLADSTRCTVHDNSLRYSIVETGTANGNDIHDNVFDAVVTNQTILTIGAQSRVHDNIGAPSLVSGGATVPSGLSQSVAVTHVLGGPGGALPARVFLTGRGGLNGGIELWWSSIATTQNSGGTITLPQATITVASTTGFPSTGTLYLVSSTGVQHVAYTGVTATTFTGCTSATVIGATGTVANGVAVSSGSQFLINVTGTSTSPVTVDYLAYQYDLA